MFLTGVDNSETRHYRQDSRFGLLATPDSAYGAELVASWSTTAADNGCFNAGEKFDPDRWLRWLSAMPGASCLFAVLPDVVGDHEATVTRSMPYVSRVRDRGHKPAFVAQNGCTPELVPWAEVDSVFIGGDDSFKESEIAESIVREGVRRGKWTHVGRVNTRRRMRVVAPWGTHSCDGTVAKYDPPRIHRIAVWLNEITNTGSEA